MNTSPLPKGTYTLNMPDWQHNFNYPENYANTCFRVWDQGDRYLHRGVNSLECITVTNGSRNLGLSYPGTQG